MHELAHGRYLCCLYFIYLAHTHNKSAQVRGYKVVLKHFSHETSDLLPVLADLQKQDAANHEVRSTNLWWKRNERMEERDSVRV